MNLNSGVQFKGKTPLSNQTPGTVQTGNATWDAALKESLGTGLFPEAGSTAALQPGHACTQHHPAARYTQGQGAGWGTEPGKIWCTLFDLGLLEGNAAAQTPVYSKLDALQLIRPAKYSGNSEHRAE